MDGIENLKRSLHRGRGRLVDQRRCAGEALQRPDPGGHRTRSAESGNRAQVRHRLLICIVRQDRQGQTGVDVRDESAIEIFDRC